jgi:phosphate/sulfate permease
MNSTRFSMGFKEAVCLLYYDGPLLSYFTDNDNNHFIVVAVDVIDDQVVWYTVHAAENDMRQYANSEISLLEVMQRSSAIYESFGYFINDAQEAFGDVVKFVDIPEERKPLHTSFCDDVELRSRFN